MQVLPHAQSKLAHKGWPLTMGSLDWFAREVASSVTDYAAAGRQDPSRTFFVTNTDDCRERRTLDLRGHLTALLHLYGFMRWYNAMGSASSIESSGHGLTDSRVVRCRVHLILHAP